MEERVISEVVRREAMEALREWHEEKKRIYDEAVQRSVNSWCERFDRWFVGQISKGNIG